MNIGKLFLVLFVCLLSLTFCNNAKMNSEETAAVDQSEQVATDDVSSAVNNVEKPKENLSGEVIMLNDAEFVKRVTDIDNPKGFQYKGDTPCVVDFYADWCRPCVALSPLIAKMAEKYKGKVIFYKINVDKSGDVTKAFEIKNIPTLVFFKTNAMPGKIVGAPSEEELTKIIEENLLAN